MFKVWAGTICADLWGKLKNNYSLHIYSFSSILKLLLLLFALEKNTSQSSKPTLCSGISPGVSGIKTGSVTCKTRALPVVLSL